MLSAPFSLEERDFDDQSQTSAKKSKYLSPVWALLSAVILKSMWLILMMMMIPSVSDKQVHGFLHPGSEGILTSQ